MSEGGEGRAEVNIVLDTQWVGPVPTWCRGMAQLG
jgi:hypothetical protein